jgi:hypothetical protein
MMEVDRQDKRETKTWWATLIFTLAAICQSIYLFGSHDRFFAELTYTLVWMGAIGAWSQRLNLSEYLRKRGLKSGRTPPGKLFPRGED